MATKLCLTHRDRKATSFCHRCHRPICTECTLVTSQGSFCSSECHVLARDFREKMKDEPGYRPPGFFNKATKAGVVIVLLLLVVWFMFHDQLNIPSPIELSKDLMRRVRNK